MHRTCESSGILSSLTPKTHRITIDLCNEYELVKLNYLEYI